MFDFGSLFDSDVILSRTKEGALCCIAFVFRERKRSLVREGD